MIQTLDPIIFKFTVEGLKVALYKRPSNIERFPNVLSLPGGMVFEDVDATLEDSLTRILAKKVGFTPRFLETMAPVGNKDRDPDGWSTTIPFLCIADFQDERDTIEWRLVTKIIEKDGKAEYMLPFDHNMLITKAYEVIKNRATYSTLPLYFMPENFTLRDLQICYEALIGTEQHKAVFRKRWLNTGLLSEVGEYSPPIFAPRHKGTRLRQAALYYVPKHTLMYFERTMSGIKD